ncbi:NUDIX hydrolase [Azospirillum sp. TSO22-1]|uniref:NUDIX hydrolase n=1 Tax=Azospirillum sp. TSO22-1 TaxID=716789 RepID=UPI000D61A0CB|nr:NUDIX hydrolase [Azospirillum sp. TSO22-1]PWC44313.1 NUDIX hydrolase [Azospirillum sp. TSO22-1]
MFEAHLRIQYGALPFRIKEGRAVVLLVTTRETGRWIIPKGWPKRGVKPHKLAAREAYEEAGLVGKVSRRSCGQFHYTKRLRTGEAVACAVEVFPMEVRRELDDWPEKGQRRRSWIPPAEAALLVEEPELAALLGRVKLVV